ncbi:hypothetical protein OPT61_g3168 [Boeremia exigua]|uniref:Uncharacterized protein n=1 Tax=Boeremia exigua TaxID=749465 RepID=A0ACC2IIS3_9PLEO|nr:hypothetical protein OPT61_g3168 [Boeremia exigua]
MASVPLAVYPDLPRAPISEITHWIQRIISRRHSETTGEKTTSQPTAISTFSVVDMSTTSRVMKPGDLAIEDVVELTQFLVRIDSSNPDFGSIPGPGETTIAQYIYAWLQYREIEAHWIEGTTGRPSVVGIVRGTGGGKSLMFNGHIDTVTVQTYADNGLSGKIEGGNIYGRGAADMKSGLACQMLALARAKSMKLAGDVILAAAADEESESKGTEDIIRAGWRADFAIIAEPTGMSIVTSHKGFALYEVDIFGVSAHGSRADLGIDAICKAGYFLVELDHHATQLQTSFIGDKSEAPNVHAGTIKGGEEIASYPAKCTIAIERRTVAGENAASAKAQLQDILEGLAKTVPHFKFELRSTFSRSSYAINRDHPYVHLVAAHAETAMGIKPNIRGETFWTDMALLSDAGVPGVVWGPKGYGLHADCDHTVAMAQLVWDLTGHDIGRTARKKKPRSLTYTGCWTCRQRRVKCDERPISCENCERAKRVCGGYDIRLVWATDERGRPVKCSGHRNAIGQHRQNASKASSLDIGVTDITGSDTEDLRRALVPSKLPSCQLPQSPPSESPTEVDVTSMSMQAEAYEEIEELTSSNELLLVDDLSNPVLEPISPSYFSNQPDEVMQEDLDNTVQLSGRLSDANEVLVSDLSLVDHGCKMYLPWAETNSPMIQDASCIGWGLSTSFDDLVSDLMVDEDSMGQLSRPNRCRSRWPSMANEIAPNVGHDLVLQGSPSTILLGQFSNHLCCFMQSISHRENPFRNIYLSTALDGSHFLNSGQIRTQQSLASISVYHSVLAVAAIHLAAQRVSASRAYIEKVACLHRTKALEAARAALRSKISSYRHVLTAILCLIIDGGVKDHWIHLEAASKLQKSNHKVTLISRQTQQLNTICSMLTLFARTAIYDHSPLPWRPDLLAADEHAQSGFPACVEFLYGMTPTITKAIYKTLRLSQCINFYRQQDLPEALLEECESLHDELSSWDIALECFSTIETTDSTLTEIMKAQATASYNATLIYYYRSIQHCQRNDLKKEQQEVLAAMNAVEDMKALSCDHVYSSGPVTWPAFIASCEAIGPDREAWARWWDRIQFYYMANYVKQKAIIESVWAQIDDYSDGMDWREVLSKMSVRVIPV